MPKKTKEINDSLENTKPVTSKKVTTKKSAVTSKKTVNENEKTAKKVAVDTDKKSEKVATVPKKTTAKKSKVGTATTKKATAKKSETATSVPKKSVTKKSTVANKKTTSKKSNKNIVISNSDSLSEYYDLPYSYDKTMIKLLAQTPKVLFVYWEVSENDRQNFIKYYGEEFFNSTLPVLTVYNETKDYYFNIPINDFANSWYINVPDEDCKYIVKLRRIFKDENVNLPNQYFEVSSSNEITNPNGHILIKSMPKKVEFINIRSKVKCLKDSCIHSYYKKIYDEKFIKEFDLDNPSSNFKNS